VAADLAGEGLADLAAGALVAAEQAAVGNSISGESALAAADGSRK